MRADRLLNILLTLQTEGRVKAGELARRQGVSRRTIYRDLDALTAAGVPVYAVPGPAGGVALLGDYRTDLTGLSRTEIQALLLGRSGTLLGDLGLAGAAEGARTKLLAALPTPRRSEADDAKGRFFVDVTGWRNTREAVPLLPRLQEAVWAARELHLTYARGDGVRVQRRVQPLGLVARGSTWYLVADVVEDDTAEDGEGSDKRRTYRVSRIGEAVLGEAFVRPEGFDLEAHWEASKLEFKARLPRYPVTVRAAPEVLRKLEAPNRYARLLNASEAADERGWRTAELLFEVDWEALETLLGFGAAAEVLAPEDLRERVRGVLRAAAAFYELDPP